VTSSWFFLSTLKSDIFASISLELVVRWESGNCGITNYCASLKLQVNHAGKAELRMWTERHTGIVTVRIAVCYIKMMVQQTDLTWRYIHIPLSKHQDCNDVLLATVLTNVLPLLTSTSFATVTILKWHNLTTLVAHYHTSLFVILGFCCEVVENLTLLGYYVASSHKIHHYSPRNDPEERVSYECLSLIFTKCLTQKTRWDVKALKAQLGKQEIKYPTSPCPKLSNSDQVKFWEYVNFLLWP